MKKFDVSINMTCRTYGINAKTEQQAKEKALKLMLQKALEKNPTFWNEVQDLETTFVVDSDDYTETDNSDNGIKSLNFRS